MFKFKNVTKEHLELKHFEERRLIFSKTINIYNLDDFIGEAETDILPGRYGYIRFQASTWKARCCGDKPIMKGQTVMVLEPNTLPILVLSSDEWMP